MGIQDSFYGVWRNISVGLGCILAGMVGSAWAEDTSKDRVREGNALPEVMVQNEKGEPVGLRDLTADQPAVLVFYRGGWCMYCTAQLSELAGIEDDLLEAGYRLYAISPDQPSKLAETPGRTDFNYTLLSDSDMEAAQAFGIAFQVPGELVETYKTEYEIDLEAASGKTHHLLPHPAVYVVGTDGLIRFAYVDEDYKERLETDDILEAVR